MIALIETRGLKPRQAALAAGIPSSSWYDLVDADPELQSDCERAAARFESALVGSILRDAISLKSWRAKLALLQAAAPWWTPTQKLDIDASITATAEDRADRLYPGEALDQAIADLQMQALSNMASPDLEAALEAEIARRKEHAT